MRTDALRDTPVFRVWVNDDLFWSRAEPEKSKLVELVPGNAYWFVAEADCSIGEGESLLHLPAYKYLQVVWPYPGPPKIDPMPKIIGGQSLTEAGVRNVALYYIERLGLAPIFNRAHVSEVRVLDEAGMVALGYGPKDGGGQIWSERVIVLADRAFWPDGLGPASLLHEAMHLLIRDAGLYDGFPKDEMRAYTMSQIVHWLMQPIDGEQVEVFKDGNPGLNYPSAVKLMQLPWPGQI